MEFGTPEVWEVYQQVAGSPLSPAQCRVCCGFSYCVLMQDCLSPKGARPGTITFIQLIGNHGNKKLRKFSQVLLKQDLFLLDIQRCRFIFQVENQSLFIDILP